MTAEEFLEIPDDGRERWLIRGALREGEMTRRTLPHSRAEAKVAQALANWVDQPAPRGAVYAGEAGFIFRREPDTIRGIDVASVDPQAETRIREQAHSLAEVLLTLCGEVLSPSARHDRVVEQLNEYLDGIPHVWGVDPDLRPVTVHRPGSDPHLFTEQHVLTAEPEMAGLSVPVASIFA